MKELLNKVFYLVDNYHSYHCWYYCTNAEYYDTCISFEVHGHSYQDEGADWIEYWSIDNNGKIYTEDTTYDSLEDFSRCWV